jgi:hypothetical protein
MNKFIAKQFIINTLIYSAIALALYFLYSPFNNHPKNKTTSSVKFVYQQF